MKELFHAMVIVNIDQAKSQLSDLLELSLGGEEVIIAKDDTSLVMLQPVPGKTGIRRGGQHRGKVLQSEDWNSAGVNKEIESTFL
ncbi:hypothetical protein C900_00278 [Fulvivirga imtechensis AK7]|uniref:Uncharacterized protein n=1 Tax=Fulvivirga imtechensis AK7 TaxID=1237149 RepID=L8JMC0_9BACT|nr:hypothetical protein [Fulvivirga imtechensis]ELR68537.1 hypothetical protein C900_00278 [Fulvivirga imtechensis AK7]